MMHITCLNSAVSLRCRCPLPSLFDDPTYFDTRFERNPFFISSSPACCCCCCCAYNDSIYSRLPRINPSFLCNGLRQSTLIQFSPCTRLVFHGGRRQSCNNTSGFSSLTDLDRSYYHEKLYSFKEKRKQGGLGKSRYACRGFEDKRKQQPFSNAIGGDYVDDVEVMLSLLTEEVGLEYIGLRDRKRFDKKDPRYATGKPKKAAVKKSLKCDNTVVEVRTREEDDRRLRNERREEEKGTFVKGVKREPRKEGSSCSSYYSVSSVGEFESDNDVEINRDGCFVGDQSSNYEEEVKEKVDSRQEIGKEGQILKKNTAGNQDWRKKSEKKLNDESGQHQSHESVNSEGNGQRHSENVDRITDQSQSRMKYKSFSEASEKDDRVIESTSSSQKRYVDTEKKINASVQEASVEQRRGTDAYRRQSNVISKVSQSHGIDTRYASSSSSSFEVRMKNSEDNSTEVGGRVDDGRGDEHQKMDQLTNTDSRRETRETSSSEEKVTMAQQVARRRERIEGEYLTSGVELGEGTMERYDILDERVRQTESMKPGRRTTKALSFHVGMRKEAAGAYKALKLNPETNLQEGGDHDAGASGSIPMVMASPAEQVSRGQLLVDLTHERSSEHYETGTGEPQERPQEGSRVQRSEMLGGRIGGDSPWEPLSFVAHEDAIASADQQQQSSSRFVDEFVEKAKHELSTSEVQPYEEDEPDGSGGFHQKDGARGPSDEMWHETGASAHEPSETDAPDNVSSTGKGESSKKSGRSLWNVIGDIVRLRWAAAAPRSETHTPRSGVGKVSPNLSMSSEAWFSGHEPEEYTDENVKTGSAKGRLQSQKDISNPSSSKEKAQYEGLDTPLTSMRMRRSPIVQKSSGTGETDASGSGRTVKMVQPVPKPLTGTSPADVSGSGKMAADQLVAASVTEAGGSKDGELKRRKLERIDQVSKDRFDEWEEAYTLEARQRKTDELFMREALLEAKKAADVWEVPVGAVLVRDGKIIARGYNLVEQMRDSTAHAEMICIREASNNLHSWRLAGTTLYVTLEPCPMCAGAILQARIDTVVWGAPNKLLGADGSWVRLFPDGVGGGGSDKPPAPVHPFHPNMVVRRGVLSTECADAMQQFFQLRRKKKTVVEPPTSPPSSSCLPVAHHHHSKLVTKMHDAFNIMFCL